MKAFPSCNYSTTALKNLQKTLQEYLIPGIKITDKVGKKVILLRKVFCQTSEVVTSITRIPYCVWAVGLIRTVFETFEPSIPLTLLPFIPPNYSRLGNADNVVIWRA